MNPWRHYNKVVNPDILYNDKIVRALELIDGRGSLCMPRREPISQPRHASPAAQAAVVVQPAPLVQIERVVPDAMNEPKEDDESKVCAICAERSKKCAFIPCGHKCLCVKCSRDLEAKIRSREQDCLICRSNVTSIVVIYDV